MKVFRVFLASPSDLEEERKAAQEVVEGLNPIIREVDSILELRGWEDRSPVFGRPQEHINEDVDGCDLFVGILSHRWGSHTGKYSSGFEEEFERAVSRRRRSESPEISLYFKRVADTSDPGGQLRRVLEFRDRIEQERELLYSEFRDMAEWKTVFSRDLLRYVLKRAPRTNISDTQSAAITTAPTTKSGPTQMRLANAELEVPEQLIRLSLAVEEAVRAPDAGQLDARLCALAEADVVRLHLLSAAVMYETVSSDTLSNHAANLVYRHREALGTLSSAERRFVLASLLREGNRNVPGWYWIASVPDEDVADWLGIVVVEHADQEVRTSTLRLLSSRPYLQGMTRTKALLAAVLDEPSDEIQKAGLDYADRFGDAATADIIKGRLADMPEAIARQANLAIGRILARQDPNAALHRMLETDSESDGRLLLVIAEASESLDHTQLRRMLAHKSFRLRVKAAETLASKDVLSAEDAKTLLSDSEAQIRAIGIRRLIALGERPTADKIRELLADAPNTQRRSLLSFALGAQDAPISAELVEELFSTFSYDELLRLVNWFTLDGPVAYKVLGLNHFGRFGGRVRKDMADRFAAFHESEKERLRADFVKNIELEGRSPDAAMAAIDVGTAQILDKWKSVDELITSGFVRAALAALAKNGSANDLLVARQQLNSEDRASREASLDIVSRFGNDADVDMLVELAAREYGDVAERAAEAALSLSADRWIRSRQFVERGVIPFLRVGVRALGTDPEFSSRWTELVPDLLVSNTDVRLATVKLLCSHLKKGDLNELLHQYLKAETYYYDVVAVLDRSIYGPKEWRSI